MTSLPFSSRYSTRSAMMRDADAVDVDLALRSAAGADADVRRRAVDDGFVVAGLVGQRLAVLVGRRHVVGRRDGIVLARLVDLHRLAVEIRVGEMAGRAAEVDQREIDTSWCPRGRGCRGRRSA